MEEMKRKVRTAEGSKLFPRLIGVINEYEEKDRHDVVRDWICTNLSFPNY
jgi:hypothetical protein